MQRYATIIYIAHYKDRYFTSENVGNESISLIGFNFFFRINFDAAFLMASVYAAP